MLAGLTTTLVLAIAVVPPGGGEDGCPSSRQVTDALQARLPWALAPGAAAPAPGAAPPPAAAAVAPGVLRLGLGATPAGGVRVQLTDASGEAVLVRALPPAGRTRPADCVALAETVALIVDRYLHDVGYEAPPSPAPPRPPEAAIERPAPAPAIEPSAAAPPRWWLGLGVDGRYGDTGAVDGALLLAGGREGALGRWRAGLRLAVGMARAVDARWPGNSASLRRLPLRLGAYLSLRAGPGRFEPGIDAGADLLLWSLAARPPGASGTAARLAPFGGASLGYAVGRGRFFARAVARGGVAVPYRFVALPGNPELVVWSTPRTYLELGVESGVSFP